MKLWQRKPQRKRRLLTPEAMNLAKANGQHERDERYKRFSNNVRMIAVGGGIAAIPILFIIWCVTVYLIKPDDLPDSIYLGITSVVSFVLGRSNIFPGNKEED